MRCIALQFLTATDQYHLKSYGDILRNPHALKPWPLQQLGPRSRLFIDRPCREIDIVEMDIFVDPS